MVFRLAFLILLVACSDSNTSPCGESGEHVGAVCAYAVVEGGFRCPPSLPAEFEVPGGGRICAPTGTLLGDLPREACVLLGQPDCSEARPYLPGRTDGGMDAGMLDASTDVPVFDVAPPDAPMCVDDVEATSWSGMTPSGDLDFTVDGFSAGDCITISGAFLNFSSADGEGSLSMTRFPVMVDGDDLRFVEPGTFTTTANFFAPDAPAEEGVDIRVDVTRWQEHRDGSGHEIDIAITIDDARFGSDPIIVRGRFCEWSFLLC